jgi:hypothetical protein
MTNWRLALLYWSALSTFLCYDLHAAGREFPFQLSAPAEAVAEMTVQAPGASWAKSGAEAPLARLSVDGAYNQDIVVISHGPAPWTYRVFLGRLAAGTHRLMIERNDRWSAPRAGLEVGDVKVTGVTPDLPDYRAIEHIPILFARADTIGHFSDVPMLMWYEVFPEDHQQTIQYSIVFSNEDGGTPTDALMARWGRATDIEYVYRVTLDDHDRVLNESYQDIEEKAHPFRGRKEDQHPFILDTSPNNDFTDTGYTPIQYRMLPVRVDLSQRSREELMDRFPWTYRIMGEELEHEGKIRLFDVPAGTAIGDPRNYLYLEINAHNRESGLVVWVKLKGDARCYSSHRGRLDLVISRSGWYRTTVELPPGTRAGAIEFIGLECLDLRNPFLAYIDENPAPTGESDLEAVSKVFLLSSDYVPEANLLEVHQTIVFHPGDMYTFFPKAH